MPTTYTHYKFGKEVLEALPRPLKESIETHRQLYDIGVHGPDILFYIRSPFKKNVRKTGTGLHHQSSVAFFEHAKEVISNTADSEAEKAYIYGCVTHFVLDSECHKYVEKMIEVSGVGHNEIETEFDAYLLKQERKNPIKYKRTKHIEPSAYNAKIIAPFYNHLEIKTMPTKENVQKTITALDVRRSILAQLSIHKLLTAKTPIKRRVLYFLTGLMKDKDAIRGLIVNETPNPKCADYNELLKKIYSGAIPLAVSLIMQYQKYLQNGDALSPRFNQTYDEGDNWRNVVL